MEVLDAEWRSQLEAIRSETPIYEWLRNVPNADKEKARFIEERDTYCPDLKPEIDLRDNDKREAEFLDLQHRLLESDAPQVVKDAYIPRIQAKLLGVGMLKAAARNDVESFVAINDDLYGLPDKTVFDSLGNFFTQFAESMRHDPNNPEAKHSAQKAHDLLPASKSDLWWPAESDFVTVKEMFATFFDEMYLGIELPQLAQGEIVFEITRRVLANLGFDYEVVDQSEGVSTMSMNSKKRLVKIPRQQQYTRARLKGLLGHEVRIHIEEAEMGHLQPLQLLSEGLRNCTAAGEGKGVLVEQIAYDSLGTFMKTRRFFDIARRQYSIGLARGIDGNGERNFAEVFNIINALDEAWELTNPGTDITVAKQKAFNKTWELLLKRTLKGVSGRGAAYSKDKVYAEGNLKQWDLLLKHPEVYPHLNKGKYDLTIPEHVRILKAIGTIPEDLLAA
jgi:hypothetical protein